MGDILGLKEFVDPAQGGSVPLKGYVDYVRSPAVGLKEYVHRTRTGPDGVYRFEAVLAGAYVMDVVRVGYAQEEVRIEVRADVPAWVQAELRRMGYRVETRAKTSGPITAIYFDRDHGTMWGAASDFGEDYGIAW